MLLSVVGSCSAVSLAAVTWSFSCLSSSDQFGQYSFLAPLGMLSFAACRIARVNSLLLWLTLEDLALIFAVCVSVSVANLVQSAF